MKITSSELLRLRLQSQGLTGPFFTEPGEVVRHFGVMQAQDYLSAKWAIGVRARRTTAKDIEKALGDKKIVRSWSLRGTLQFMAPEDIRWILGLIAPRMKNLYRTNYERLGLDDAVLSASAKAMRRILSNGPVARKRLREKLREGGLPVNEMRANFLLLRAALDGLICFGSMEGKQHTFVLLDDWLPKTEKMKTKAAEEALALKYFTCHGPASVQDFAWWSGQKQEDIRAAIKRLGKKLIEVESDGKKYWIGKAVTAGNTKGQRLHLLPAFDEYFVGYKDRSAALHDAHLKKVIGMNGLFAPTVVHRGKAIGTWRRTFAKSGVEIETSLFSGADVNTEKSIVKEAKRFGDFWGMIVRIR